MEIIVSGYRWEKSQFQIEEMFQNHKDYRIHFWDIEEVRKRLKKKNLACDVCIIFTGSTVGYLLKEMKQIYNCCQLIVVSDTYDILPFLYKQGHDYWISQSKLESELPGAVELLGEQGTDQRHFICTGQGKRWRIPLNKIYYAEIRGRKLKIHDADKIIVTINCSIAAFVKKLPENFQRVHASYVINTNYLRAMDSGEGMLDNGAKIPVSRDRAKALGAFFSPDNGPAIQ